jgi:hypothetical protein
MVGNRVWWQGCIESNSIRSNGECHFAGAWRRAEAMTIECRRAGGHDPPPPKLPVWEPKIGYVLSFASRGRLNQGMFDFPKHLGFNAPK